MTSVDVTYVEVISARPNDEIQPGYVSKASTTVGGKVSLDDSFAIGPNGYGGGYGFYHHEVKRITKDEYLYKRLANSLTSEQKKVRQQILRKRGEAQS